MNIDLMNEWKELDMLLEKHHEHTYINEWNVMFNRVAPEFIMVGARWPGFEGNEDVSLVFFGNDAKNFFEKLRINNAGQLEHVTSENLLELYYSGDAVLVCSTDCKDSLEFVFNAQKLFAKNGRSNLFHEVKEVLLMPGDYIKYTKQYFLSSKDQLKITGN